MSKIFLLLIMVSTYVLASDAEHAGTDIVQRTVNFLLFAGVVWFLVAEPLKNYFGARSQAIANDLKKVQDKLNESITLKKEAMVKIKEAESFAQELSLSSKKEYKILNDNILKQCDNELEIIANQHKALVELEQKNMLKDVVEETLKDVLEESSDTFNREAMANVILKKVA